MAWGKQSRCSRCGNGCWGSGGNLTSVSERECRKAGKVFEWDLHLGGALGADLLLAKLTPDAPREQAKTGLHAEEANLVGEETKKKYKAKINISVLKMIYL